MNKEVIRKREIKSIKGIKIVIEMIPAIVEECFSEFFKNQTFKVRDVKHGFAYVKNLSADVLVLGMRCVIDDPYHWLLLTASIIVALFLAYGLYYLLFRPANWTRVNILINL